MGCCNSKKERDKANLSIEHGRYWEDAKKKQDRDNKCYKMLFVGAAFSGKSTAFRQFQRMSGDGAIPTYESFKTMIRHQVLSQMVKAINIGKEHACLDPRYESDTFQDIVEQNNMRVIAAVINDGFDVTRVPHTILQMIQRFLRSFIVYADYSESRQYILDLAQTDNLGDVNSTEVTELARHVEILWSRSQLRSLFELRHVLNLKLYDSTQYFCENAKRIFDAEYLPSDDDILKIAVHSKGIVTHVVENKQFVDTEFKMFDVGGLRTERKKWIHCFYDLKAVIFCADASCYDRYLEEHEESPAMREQLKLFENIINSRWFDRDTVKILLLTHVDKLEERLKNVPLNVIPENYDADMLKEYEDACKTKPQAEAALEMMQAYFKAANKNSLHEIYVFSVNLLDNSLMESVSWDIMQLIIRSNLSLSS